MTSTQEKCCCGHLKAGHKYNTEGYPYRWECSAVIYIDNYRYSCQCNDLKADVEEPICTHTDKDTPASNYGTSNPPEETDWNYIYCPTCGEKL